MNYPPTISYSNAAVTNTKIQVVNSRSAGLTAFNFTCYNPHATDVAYIQFFDLLTGDVTLGTTVPKFILPLPAKGGVDGGLYLPRQFSTAITIAATLTATGNAAPTSAVIAQFDYCAWE